MVIDTDELAQLIRREVRAALDEIPETSYDTEGGQARTEGESRDPAIGDRADARHRRRARALGRGGAARGRDVERADPSAPEPMGAPGARQPDERIEVTEIDRRRALQLARELGLDVRGLR